MLQRVVFLDRDGVINEDSPHYIKNWGEFRFLPGSLDALKRLRVHDYATILITNQSMIGRGLSSLDALQDMHHNMRVRVDENGGHIRDIFFCPHRPDERCDCRKPKPGLIHQARKSHSIDLSSAVMVGDSAKDIECARNAGLGHAVLVRTGNGISAEEQLRAKRVLPDYIADDLLNAVEWILARHAEI